MKNAEAVYGIPCSHIVRAGKIIYLLKIDFAPSSLAGPRCPWSGLFALNNKQNKITTNSEWVREVVWRLADIHPVLIFFDSASLRRTFTTHADKGFGHKEWPTLNVTAALRNGLHAASLGESDISRHTQRTVSYLPRATSGLMQGAAYCKSPPTALWDTCI